MALRLPSPEEVWVRINRVKDETIRCCLQACYLWCARISEVVAIPEPHENAYGPKAGDVEIVDYNGVEVCVFDVRTAKRGGFVRKIALPLKSCFELYSYFQKFHPREYVFRFRRWVPKYHITAVEPVFEGLHYPIETYVVSKNGQLFKVPRHERVFRLHALRHVRATELVERYGFDGFNLAAFGGWTLRTSHAFFGATIPPTISRYLYLNWQGYIDKLLRRTAQVSV